MGEGHGREKKVGVRKGDTLLTVNVALYLQSEYCLLLQNRKERTEKVDFPLLDALNWRKIPDKNVEMQVAEKTGSNQT